LVHHGQDFGSVKPPPIGPAVMCTLPKNAQPVADDLIIFIARRHKAPSLENVQHDGIIDAEERLAYLATQFLVEPDSKRPYVLGIR